MKVTTLDTPVAEQIGHAFGYYDYGEEVGMGAFYRSKDAVATYIAGYVRMAFEGGMLYTMVIPHELLKSFIISELRSICRMEP